MAKTFIAEISVFLAINVLATFGGRERGDLALFARKLRDYSRDLRKTEKVPKSAKKWQKNGIFSLSCGDSGWEGPPMDRLGTSAKG